MIDFDWTIRASDFFTAGSAIVVVAGLLYRRGRADRDLEAADEAHETRIETAIRMSTMETSALKEEISAMKEKMEQLATIMAKMAVQETKIDLLMKWYDELRRGVGVITNPEFGAR